MRSQEFRANELTLYYKSRWRKKIDKEINILLDKVNKYIVDFEGVDMRAKKIERKKE